MQIDRSNIEPDKLITAAKKILAPYDLSYKHCQWWTAYRIGQRVGSVFSAHERVFLAGDAVHTHSPKAGQGMNISMHDSEASPPSTGEMVSEQTSSNSLKQHIISDGSLPMLLKVGRTAHC